MLWYIYFMINNVIRKYKKCIGGLVVKLAVAKFR
jgi:hypothetical protein